MPESGDSEFDNTSDDNIEEDNIEELSPRQPVIPTRERRPSLPTQNLTALSEEDERSNSRDPHSKRDEQPLVYLDVTIGHGKQAPLIIYEYDNYMEVAESFCRANLITDMKKERLFKAVNDAMQCI